MNATVIALVTVTFLNLKLFITMISFQFIEVNNDQSGPVPRRATMMTMAISVTAGDWAGRPGGPEIEPEPEPPSNHT